MDSEYEKIDQLIKKYNTELLMHMKVIMVHAIKEAVELDLDPLKKYLYIEKAYNDLIDYLIVSTGNKEPITQEMQDEIIELIDPYENEALNQIYDLIDELYEEKNNNLIDFDDKYQEIINLLENTTLARNFDTSHDIKINGIQYIKNKRHQ